VRIWWKQGKVWHDTGREQDWGGEGARQRLGGHGGYRRRGRCRQEGAVVRTKEDGFMTEIKVKKERRKSGGEKIRRGCVFMSLYKSDRLVFCGN
jgi:hypothetical protein